MALRYVLAQILTRKGHRMDFYEVEGKKILLDAGIPTDVGVLIDENTDLNSVEYPCVVKAQVLSGKRGKAGGIKFAHNPEELKQHYDFISNMTIGGHPVSGVLITPMAAIASEHYIGLTIDRKAKCIVLIYSPCGGMDIEEVAESQPDQLLKMPVYDSFEEAEFARSLERFDLSDEAKASLCGVARKLYEAFVKLDATTIEINPYAQMKDGSFAAVDSKLVIDDNAKYRQDDYTILPREAAESAVKLEAEQYGLSFVDLDENGGIGLIAGGAGIGMATVDSIKYYGASPYNFMDLGGGVTEEKMYHAVRLLLNDDKVDSILINVFGGINNCLTMAEGITRAIIEFDSKKPVVVKSRGFSQEAGWELYDKLNLPQVRYGTTDDAVKLLLKVREGAKV